ncbi:uncharacterized, partial [Tachysurus ichikawai]
FSVLNDVHIPKAVFSRFNPSVTSPPHPDPVHRTRFKLRPAGKSPIVVRQEVGEQLWSAAAKRVSEPNKATLADVKTAVKSSRPPDR